MRELLTSPLAARLLALSDDELHSVLVNDAYKIRMHQMYAKYFQGVTAEFALNIRRTPIPLEDIKQQHPELWTEFERHVARLQHTTPLQQPETDALRLHYDFTPSEEMRQRAEQNGVAPITWQSINGHLLAFSSGPVEAASNVETSMMQLVQQLTIKAQAASINNQEHTTGSDPPTNNTKDSTNQHQQIDETELLANALGKLCSTVDQINSQLPSSISIILFAGRRSSSRKFLLLQNLYFMQHMCSYAGTSSVYAVTLLDRAMVSEGWEVAKRQALVKGLKGTHAHELSMLTQQTMAEWDEKAGRACGAQGPVCLTIVLSHLLFLAANGGLEAATALADTFTTKAFIKVALAARVPPAFVEDMRRDFGAEVDPQARVFDIIRLWRLDSGDYQEVAQLVVTCWQRRCEEAQAAGQQPPARPLLMNSNLDSLQEVLSMGQLPERIRPAVLGFGTLADGFVPFQLGGSQQAAEIKMASVVMKAVQGRAQQLGQPSQACACKLGDNSSLGKLQLDPRLSAGEQQVVKQQVVGMAAASAAAELDSDIISGLLQEAYVAVTRQGLLM